MDNFNPPSRVEATNEDLWNRLGKAWTLAGEPRVFEYQGILWRQIKDASGIVFIKDRPAAGHEGLYESSSFKGM